MIRKLGWLALGGFGVGIVAFGLAAHLGADELPSWRLGEIWSSAACRDEHGKSDATATERHWPWDGGDTVEIAAPATVRYRGGSGDEVIARGSPDVIAHLRVRHGKIDLPCRGLTRHDLDITLPGRAFRAISLAGSGDLIMETVNQPSLELSVVGSGSVRAQGTSEQVKLSITGAGDMKLADLSMKRLDLRIAGSGNVEAAPQDEINIDIAGSGNVRLLSDPAEVHTHISGSGRLVRSRGRAGERSK
jgi:Putative auto-transporter adhesin, head GIN domain